MLQLLWMAMVGGLKTKVKIVFSDILTVSNLCVKPLRPLAKLKLNFLHFTHFQQKIGIDQRKK